MPAEAPGKATPAARPAVPNARILDGLCLHHLYLVLAAPDKLGGALALKTLVEACLNGLDTPQPTPCYFRGFLERTERRHAAVIIDLFRSGGDGRRAVESAPSGMPGLPPRGWKSIQSPSGPGTRTSRPLPRCHAV